MKLSPAFSKNFWFESWLSIELESHSEEETSAIASQLSLLFQKSRPKGCQTILFFADLGLGKSVFVRSLIRSFGIQSEILSPTYTILEHYQSAFGSIYHWDFYRLESEEELEILGFYEAMSQPSLHLIEWAEKFPSLFSNSLCVFIKQGEKHENHRRFSFQKV